ncbi:MAG: SRPBCC domain-containing protein [Bacteroidetes bacterium]|nr:SRPBCC domain-containing protein [Bacteroidota bacterium]
MTKDLVAKTTIVINTSASKVWEALTNPELIKKYFFGTEAISDWKVGSPLTFRGTWEGKTHEDKATILNFEPNKLLRYRYWSSLSDTPDIPENYAIVTYKLFEENSGTKITVTQDNIPTEEKREHSQQNWLSVLKGLKKLLET